MFDSATCDILARAIPTLSSQHVWKSLLAIYRSLQKIILPIVTNNANNIEVGVRESGYGSQLRCFADPLKLGMKKALVIPTMDVLPTRIQKIVKYFTECETAAGGLKQKSF